MKWVVAAFLAVSAVACTNSSSVTCSDGSVCPSGSVCVDHAPVHCVLEDQTKVCGALAQGDVCKGSGFVGICSDSICLPGCGDGAQDPGEECDDGNFASHDGCSSGCETEQPTWNEKKSPWRPRSLHAAAYDPAAVGGTGALLVFGGVTPEGNDGATWLRSIAGLQRAQDGPTLQGSAVAYDPVRHVVVVFGGTGIDAHGIDLTWELSTTGWHQVMTPTSPPRRTFAAMAYDSVRAKMIMFGGSTDLSPANFLADTWEYDGATWTQLSPASHPMGLYGHAMVYDPARQATVLFGGRRPLVRQNETWLFSSTTANWTQLTTTNTPSGRARFGMAYVASRSSIMVFGGELGPVQNASDTWELTGTAWTQIATSTSPAPRKDHTLTLAGTKLVVIGGSADELYSDIWEMDLSSPPLQWRPAEDGLTPRSRDSDLAYDAKDRKMMLFGGSPADVTADTWVFDAAGWTQLFPTSAPSTRGNHSIGYDPAGQRVVIVDGQNNGQVIDETWSWNGSTWTSVGQGPQRPAAVVGRQNARLAFDDAGTGVLFGGQAFDSTPLDDTWELVGSSWSLVAAGPQPHDGNTLAYDPVRKAMITFDQTGDTWSYAAHRWTKLAPTASPPRRAGGLVMFDTTRGKTILVGGFDINTFYSDLWELDQTAGVDTWNQIATVGAPPLPRTRWHGVYVPSLHAVVVSGSATPTRVRDTWLLIYSSTTPDEVCSDGVDNDGDLQVDDHDPDCK